MITAKRTEKMSLSQMKHPGWYHCRVLAYYHISGMTVTYGRISSAYPTWYGY